MLLLAYAAKIHANLVPIGMRLIELRRCAFIFAKKWCNRPDHGNVVPLRGSIYWRF